MFKEDVYGKQDRKGNLRACDTLIYYTKCSQENGIVWLSTTQNSLDRFQATDDVSFSNFSIRPSEYRMIRYLVSIGKRATYESHRFGLSHISHVTSPHSLTIDIPHSMKITPDSSQ